MSHLGHHLHWFIRHCCVASWNLTVKSTDQVLPASQWTNSKLYMWKVDGLTAKGILRRKNEELTRINPLIKKGLLCHLHDASGWYVWEPCLFGMCRLFIVPKHPSVANAESKKYRSKKKRKDCEVYRGHRKVKQSLFALRSLCFGPIGTHQWITVPGGRFLRHFESTASHI